LKPTQPAEPAQIVSPSKSVIVISVLLNVAFMCATALTTFFLTFRFAPFAIISKTSNETIRFLSSCFLYTFFACDCFPWAFACSRIPSRGLASYRQALPVTSAAVTAYVAQPGYVLRNLSSKLAADDVVAFYNLGYPAELIFGELVSLCALIDLGLF
jgi:glucan phosphoethanolaminetransferase (alkaline phosphatase superfamily)